MLRHLRVGVLRLRAPVGVLSEIWPICIAHSMYDIDTSAYVIRRSSALIPSSTLYPVPPASRNRTARLDASFLCRV